MDSPLIVIQTQAVPGMTREDDSAIEPNDPVWEKLKTAAIAAKSNPQAWLNQSDLYGDLADSSRFQNSVQHWLARIWSDGVEGALQSYLPRRTAS